MTTNATGRRTSPRWLQWVLWLGALVVVTAALRVVRGQMEQVHVTLIYLLLVLGASASGGRSIGLVVATFAIAAIDFFFQSPYDTIVVHENLDWLVLLTFYITAIVATSLLARARIEADRAYRGTIEARELAQLGAQTMRHGSPSEALQAIAALFRERLDAGRCVIRGWNAGSGLNAVALGIANRDFVGGGGIAAERRAAQLRSADLGRQTLGRGCTHGGRRDRAGDVGLGGRRR